MSDEESNMSKPQELSVRSGLSLEPDPWAPSIRSVAQSADRQAFQRLYAHFAPLIKAFLAKGMSARMDRSVAEEMTQEVMLKVWKKADSFNGSKASVNTWIFTIARNTRIDFIRSSQRADRTIEIEDIWHEADSPEPLVEMQQRRLEVVVRQALDTLPAEQALVLEKAFVESLSHNEIAEALGLPLGTVKSRIRLALNKLQILIDR
jgi:RNA polymerase sigma factor (sigma-70 family)